MEVPRDCRPLWLQKGLSPLAAEGDHKFQASKPPPSGPRSHVEECERQEGRPETVPFRNKAILG